MPWLTHHNPEIDWKKEEIKMTRCPEECRKKWRVGKQTKLGWKKQEKCHKLHSACIFTTSGPIFTN